MRLELTLAIGVLVLASACSDDRDDSGASSGGSAGSSGAGAVEPVHACDKQTRGTVTSTPDVGVYDPDVAGQDHFPTLLADVYIPDAAHFPGPRPGIVMIHGGCAPSVGGGDPGGGCRKGAFADDAPYFAGRGYAVVVVQYRYPNNYFDPPTTLDAEHDLARMPAPLQDIRCAIRWMRSTSVAGLDVLDDANVITYGGSGGGYLSLNVLAESAIGSDPSWSDNPACPFEQPASVQGAVAGFPRLDDRPERLDLTPPSSWPPDDPADFAAASGAPALGNYFTESVQRTLDHLYGATNFPSVYATDASVRERVDRAAVTPRVSPDWGPLFITHSVWDDLNYWAGSVELVDALAAAGHPQDRLTLVGVSRVICKPPIPQDAPTAMNDTLVCGGHDYKLVEAYSSDDPVDGGDRNADGRPDYDGRTSFCTMQSFFETHFPP